MISGINHITLAVSDLSKSFSFYRDVVGLTPIAKWLRGAYLTAGCDWVCLSLDNQVCTAPRLDYTHLAFSVDAESFTTCAASIRAQDVMLWKENSSEGDSLYFLDPDGHKLEIHVGNLASRLAFLKQMPYEGLELFI